MKKLSLSQFITWRRIVDRRIAVLNSITIDSLGGEDYYYLGYRGKRHRLALLCESEYDEVIAYGLNILPMLNYLIDYYQKEKQK